MNSEDMRGYGEFFESQLKELKCLDFAGDTILWHYTTGDSLIKIIESGELYATQVSCLNDSTEVRYSAGVLLNAIRVEREKESLSVEVQSLLDRMLIALTEQPVTPSHGPSPYFVS